MRALHHLRRLCSGLAALAILFQPVVFSGAASTPAELSVCSSDVCLLESSLGGVTVEVRLPPYSVSQSTLADGKVYDSIQVAGWDLPGQAGQPQLPARSLMIGIPLQAELSLRVVDVRVRELAGPRRIVPAPQPVVDWELPDSPLPRYVGEALAADPAVYSRNSFYPGDWASIVNQGFIRHQRVATIRLAPFQYNPVSGRVRVADRLVVQIVFSYPASPSAVEPFSGDEPGGFEELLASNLLNYQSAREWRGAPTSRITQAWSPPQPGYKISVRQDGIYRLTYSDLSAAGVPVDFVNPATFQLFHQGQEVAIYVQGEEDGTFDAGDYILFYGLDPRSKYTLTNVYWLTHGQQAGRRMAWRDGAPGGGAPTPLSFEASQRIERNSLYFSNAAGDDELDRWLWNHVYPPSIPSRSYSVNLVGLPSGEYTATLQMAFYGGIAHSINPDHHTRVYVNNNLVQEAWWDGRGWRITQAAFPQAYLVEGLNVIRVECPNDTGVGYDLVYVDWFNLNYRSAFTASNDQLAFNQNVGGAWEFHVGNFSSSDISVFDITDPLGVSRVVGVVAEPVASTYTLKFRDVITGGSSFLALTPARYLSPDKIELDVPSAWRSPARGADYVVIAPSDFYTQAAALANYRAGQGLRAVVVNLQDVFDEFSYGLYRPAAIRDLLAYAYNHWAAPAPAYVALIGDGLYDFRNDSNSGMKNYLPPYLAYVDPWLGETSADNRYVSVSGNDILPDMHIGRLAVNTPAEADAALAKIIAYEQTPPAGDWNARATFVADNPDLAGDFYTLSNNIISGYLPAPYVANTIYLGQTCPYQNPSVVCRQAIINNINITGTLLVNYIGHAAINRWADEKLLTVADIPALTNSGRYPIFLPMTCYEGYYIYPVPSIPSLAESLVRAPNKGAVASWSAAGLGLASGHDYLNKGFFKAVFLDDARELGAATLEGKLWVYASGSNYDLIETYHLFGDPALRLNVLKADVSIAKSVTPTDPVRPGSAITYTLVYSNVGPATAHHVVISDALPAGLINPVISASSAITPRVGSRFVWDAADLPAGQARTITIRATIDPAFIGALTNTARIATSAVETTTVNNVTAPVVTTLIYPDLAISKRGPAQARPGSPVTYTLVYSNVGQALAEQVVITDILPAGLMASTAAYMWSGVAVTPRGGAPFVWDAPQLAVGQRGVITVTAMISPTFSGALSNSARIANAIAEPNTANNVAGPVLTQMVYPDLAISKRGPAQARPGERITYTLAFTNVGAAAADTVVITDELSGLLRDAAYTSVGAPLALRPASRFVWETPSLAVGQGGVITITATIAPTFTGVLSNAARIAGAIVETSTSNNTSGPILTEMLTPDLEIHKAGPANSRSGDVITYTLTYINKGAAPASQVVITDLVPSALQSITFAYSGALPVPRGGDPYVWDLSGNLEAGQSGVITVSAVISPGFVGLLTNTAAIGGAQVEKNWSNNISERIVTGVDMPDLVIAKWGPPYALAGSRLTYTLAYSNEGLAVASQVVITDLVPSELLSVTFDASDPGLTPRPGAPFVWDAGDLPPGAGGVITLSGVLSPTLSGVISNTAYITTSTFERDVNNVAGPIVTRVGVPDLEIRKQGPALVLVGSPVTYTLFYSNVGIADAVQVVISDIIPAGLTNVQVTFSGAAIAPRAGTAFVWDVVSALPPGAGGVITISGVLEPAFAGELVNTAQIATATPEWNLANNETEPVSTYVGLPDLAIYKQGTAKALVGSRITYTLTFSNVGSFAASGIVITDALPAALTDVDVDASGAAIAPRAGTAFVWDVADLIPGAGGVITISGVLTPSFAGELVNTAQIATTTPEWNLANNETPPVSTQVGWPDLAIRKHAPDRVWSGSSITYTLAFSNAGAVTASNVVISDALPAQLTNIRVISTGVPLAFRPGSRLAWDIAGLAAGQGGVITITATVPPTFEGELINTAYISAATPESATSNNVAGPFVTQAGRADVMIRKWGPAEALSGSYITYTLAYSNVGSFAAANVVIADALPLALTPVSVITSGAVIIPRPGKTFVWDAAELAPLEGGLITITARVAPTLTGQIVNWGHISSASPDRNDANNRAGPVTTQVGLPDVAISKSGPAETPGGVITYTLVYSNIGSMVAHGVVISDILPPALVSPTVTFTGPTPLLRPGSRLVWDIGDLAAKQGGVITITARIDSAFGETLVNTAAIGTADPEADWTNNTASAATFVWRRQYCPLVVKNY